jgi:hypothetical protein
MNKTIDVFIYSYKGKNVKEVIDQLNKTAKNILMIEFFDQNPIDRSELFNDVKNLKYRNIMWDSQISPCIYKDRFIKKSKSDYILLLSDNIIFSDGWDERFINFINNEIIISGSGITTISQNDSFSITKNISDSSLFNLTNYINRDFIFGNTGTIKKIQYPYYLKYNGEEEILSISAYCQGIDIYSSPTTIYSKCNQSIMGSVYVPFSLDHFYNEAILLFNGKNNFIKLDNKRTIDEFEQFHKFVFKDNLSKLPYIKDDVLYDPNSINFGNMGGRKFIDKVKKVD